MDNIDTASVAENMIVEESAPAEDTVTMDTLTGNLEKPVEEASKEGNAPVKEEKTPEQARKDAVSEGLNSLREEGVTSEELLAFSQDEAARKDIQAGKDVVRAFMAYSRRQASAVKSVQTEPEKKGVPTVTAQATASAGDRPSIKDMSKKEFAELSKKAREAVMMGKKVTFK